MIRKLKFLGTEKSNYLDLEWIGEDVSTNELVTFAKGPWEPTGIQPGDLIVGNTYSFDIVGGVVGKVANI